MNNSTNWFAKKKRTILELQEKRIAARNAEFDEKYPFHADEPRYIYCKYKPRPEVLAEIAAWLRENMGDNAWAYDASRHVFGFTDDADALAYSCRWFSI